MSGYEALHESAAWLDVSSRGRLRATGEDRLRLLHALASNVVDGLEPGQGTYAFFLDAQGHIQADSHVFVAADHALIDCEPQPRRPLYDHINGYIIMDDVELADATESTAAIALEGPRSDDIARQALGAVLPAPEPYAHRESGGVLAARMTISGQPGLCFVCPAGQKGQLLEKLEAGGAKAAGEQDFRVMRVENRRPRFGEDYSSLNIPHETGLLQAVSFSKGCYLGQEIVERVRARGQVNKLLAGLEIDTRQPPPAGAPVEHEGKEVGRLTSPVFSPRLDKALAFAVLRRAAAVEGAAVTVNRLPGRVRALG